MLELFLLTGYLIVFFYEYIERFDINKW